LIEEVGRQCRPGLRPMVQCPSGIAPLYYSVSSVV
jgi:hypothetical protein